MLFFPFIWNEDFYDQVYNLFGLDSAGILNLGSLNFLNIYFETIFLTPTHIHTTKKNKVKSTLQYLLGVYQFSLAADRIFHSEFFGIQWFGAMVPCTIVLMRVTKSFTVDHY